MKYDVIEYRGYDGKLTLAVVPRNQTKKKLRKPKAYNPFKGEYE